MILKIKKVLIVSGIANSRSFVEFFSQNNIEYEHVNFSDHHNYTQEDINKIESDNESLIITTEKDFQKIQFLERKNKWTYLEIETKFIGDEEKFDSCITAKFYYVICFLALYEDLTSGPLSTCLNPKFFA